MKLPFGYDLRITKRGVSVLQNGQLRTFTDWKSGGFISQNTPIVEEIYTTIANEFAKIDLRHIIDNTKEGYIQLNDNLNFILSERPNPLQTKFDFMFTMMYQLFKYGNAFAILQRDKRGNVIRIDPINVCDWQMGNGYQIDEDTVFFKFKDKNNNIVLIDYNNLIHLRLNPNDIFNGDACSSINGNRVIVDIIDASLSSAINELRDSGTVRGIIQVGESGIGYSNGFANRAMLNQEAKIDKQQEIIERIKKTKGGILVLDAGETWKDLQSPFSTVTNKELDQYIDMLLQFNGINKAVVNGTATADQMEVFFNKTIAPRLDQFVSEMNYKCFTENARSRGHKVEYYRNPFEYVSVVKAIDIAYKGSQDTTTNERRRMIYKLPPIAGGDVLMLNKNFAPVDEAGEIEEGENDEQNN